MARTRKAKQPPPPSPPKAAAPSLCEALLLATVCMVGLPVEVQVRDGSAYAGVLHTACVDGGYGVVLKKARKISYGKGDANLSLGAFVDTLVVLPDDLVQVIAKDFSLPIKGVCRTLDCNVVAANGSLMPQTSYVDDPKLSTTEDMSPLKQVEKCSTAGQESDTSIKKNAQTNGNAMVSSSSTVHVGSCFSMNGISNSATVGPKVGGITSSVIAAPLVTSDVKNSQPDNNSATKIVTSSKTTAKDFKLNPSAKVFSPSFASSRQVLAAAPPFNSNYISHSAIEVPTGIPVLESKSEPGASLSSKVHYNNLSSGNYVISPQYFQSIAGHNAARLDPARVGTPYHPVQVVAGKFSPVVYVHPVSHEAMRGTAVIPQGWPRPVLLNSYQASLQKFEGNAPVYMAPPVMATGNLPLVAPSPAPLVQPFQGIHPIMVPAASSMVPGKYM
uniref:Ataxin 2 SM domain-containing protein n=1 Tax=Arundo donax TaxID=35708 RepID=A0A0A9CEH1_ARUDO